MIHGVGVDIVEVGRIRRLLERHGDRFRRRVFTTAEIATCLAAARPAERFAARFAAKEAIFKALGQPSSSPIGWRDLEVVSHPGHGPTVALHGPAKAAAAHLGLGRIHLSISHTQHQAIATCIATDDPAV